MSLTETIKNSPKLVFVSAGSIITIVSALFAIDARYAHAQVVEKDKIQTQRVIQDTAVMMRKQNLEDKLFELDVRKAQSPNQKLSPVDSALRERYQRQYDEISKKER